MDYNKKKHPFLISLRNVEIFSFGGIWDDCTLTNEKGEKETLKTFSILTTEANPLLAKIHNNKKRIPLIIHSKQEYLWINSINSLSLKF